MRLRLNPLFDGLLCLHATVIGPLLSKVSGLFGHFSVTLSGLSPTYLDLGFYAKGVSVTLSGRGLLAEGFGLPFSFLSPTYSGQSLPIVLPDF